MAPPCSADASAAPALSGVVDVLTSGLSISCWIEPGMLSPSSGSEFWSPAITNDAPGVEAAPPALVVVDVAARARRDVVGPQPDLVEVALAVAVLGAVEHRWRRVADQEVHGALADLDRQVPVALGRQTGSTASSSRRVPVHRGGVPASSGSSAPGMSFHRKFWNVRTAASSIGYIE